jgi:uncharacterized membrane protein
MPFLRIVICPNCSLSVRGALVFFSSACALSLGIGAVFALFGLWPVLPAAGLEMILLGWALHESLARRHTTQTLTITDADVSVESRDRSSSRQVVFQRHWAQVKLSCPASRLHPSRLTIESRGRRCEVGGFLTEEERRGLALRLRRLIGRMNESPPLAVGR